LSLSKENRRIGLEGEGRLKKTSRERGHGRGRLRLGADGGGELGQRGGLRICRASGWGSKKTRRLFLGGRERLGPSCLMWGTRGRDLIEGPCQGERGEEGSQSKGKAV